MWPPDEYGRWGDEQPKPHAPKMPYETFGAGNTPARDHANVPRGTKQAPHSAMPVLKAPSSVDQFALG